MPFCGAFVGMIAWWSVTFSLLTMRPSGSSGSFLTNAAALAYSFERSPTCAAISLSSGIMSLER
jgi:hypothetical protein